MKTVTIFSISSRDDLEGVEIDPEGDDAGLGHGLDQDHARRDRIAGEMAAVEIGVGREACSARRCARVELDDLVDEAEGLLLREPRASTSLLVDERRYPPYMPPLTWSTLPLT